ncbi:RNA polymerase sigma factor [Aquimarina rhabdastrellae]
MKQKSISIELNKLITGDKEFILLLYERLLPKIINYVKKNNGEQTDAEEVFHDALYQIIARAKTQQIEIRTSLEPYIFMACKNLWLKELNKRQKQVRNDGVFELKDKDEERLEAIENQKRWDLFEEKINLLSENCKQLLKDYFDKVPYEEIVKKFSYSSENVAFQRVFKCKKKLTELIKADNRYKKL